MVREFIYNLSGRELKVIIGKVMSKLTALVWFNVEKLLFWLMFCASKEPREELTFFPLSCDFEEKLYSVGKIREDLLKEKGVQVKKLF